MLNFFSTNIQYSLFMYISTFRQVFFLECFSGLETFVDLGESSIADVPVQAGDPVFGYNVTVRVRIFDIYGDYATFVKNITVSKSIFQIILF